MKQSLLKLAFAAVMLMLVAPFAGSRAVAQTHNLTGTVVDAQGNPVAGATLFSPPSKAGRHWERLSTLSPPPLLFRTFGRISLFFRPAGLPFGRSCPAARTAERRDGCGARPGPRTFPLLRSVMASLFRRVHGRRCENDGFPYGGRSPPDVPFVRPARTGRNCGLIVV